MASVPPGKFNLVDGGYANTPSFLAPYRGVRYHLKEFGARHQRPQNSKELFNHHHALLRNRVERTLGVLKKRFPILKVATFHMLENQVKIPVAATIFHNIIRLLHGDEEWFLPTTSATKKKPSPKCSGAKRSGGSPRGTIADWNPTLEKSLVEILHEYKDSGYRSDNGWNTKGWNKMVKEFHLRNKSVSYTKAQIQDKECHPAKMTYNFTSIESQRVEEPLHQINDVEEEALQEIKIRDEEDEEKDARDEEARSGERRMAALRKKLEKEGQRPRKSAKIEAMMERFLEMRTKQAEDEAKQLARENEARDKEAAKGDEYSIKRCISIINTMEVTKQEKAKAYAIFTKSKENRETFICASEEDEESALIWLRNEMA
uniref:DDE Tnp4 domain-containing protein n=1 Tax=Setaria italica TaxID=4555 RepID=K4A2V2_SETIT